VAEAARRHKARVWGKAPKSGKVLVQQKQRGGWKKVARLRVKAGRVFTKKVRVKGKKPLRAKLRGSKSITSKPIKRKPKKH
jgi:hypothetical protein